MATEVDLHIDLGADRIWGPDIQESRDDYIGCMMVSWYFLINQLVGKHNQTIDSFLPAFDMSDECNMVD